MRRAAKIDANHEAVVEMLRSCGATVQSLAATGKGCPDLLVGYRGQTFLMEIKDGKKPPSEKRMTIDQVNWHMRWNGGSLSVVYSPENALKVIGVLK
jgi:hypothetical protein